MSIRDLEVRKNLLLMIYMEDRLAEWHIILNLGLSQTTIQTAWLAWSTENILFNILKCKDTDCKAKDASVMPGHGWPGLGPLRDQGTV